MMARGIYALYKGDKFIDVGTIPEMAARLGVKKETLYFYMMPVYQKRSPNGFICFKLEEETE